MLDDYSPIYCNNVLGGPGYIAGTLKVNDIPAARRIYLTERTTYRLVATTFSNADGTYRFDGLNPEIEFDLRGQDWARVRRDDIASAVKPSTSPVINSQTVTVPIGAPFVWAVPVAYGRRPFTWSDTGTLPSGLSFSDGVFTGAWPTGAIGKYPIAVSVVDADAFNQTATITLDLVLLPLQLAPATLPSFVLGVPFSATFHAAGGEGPYTYSVSSGALPAGLSLDSVTGELAGTPTIGDAYSFTVEAEDARSGAVSLVYAGSVGAPRKHWRVHITAVDGGTFAHITELELYSGGSVNLATGGTPSASSEWDATYSASKAFDGVKTGDNCWATTNNNWSGSWLAYEFASEVYIDKIAIWSRSTSNNAMPKDFEIQSSDDGSIWATEWSVTGQTAWGISEMRTFTRP